MSDADRLSWPGEHTCGWGGTPAAVTWGLTCPYPAVVGSVTWVTPPWPGCTLPPPTVTITAG